MDLKSQLEWYLQKKLNFAKTKQFPWSDIAFIPPGQLNEGDESVLTTGVLLKLEPKLTL